MNKRWFFIVLLFAVVMVNPPVVYWANDWCRDNPILFGWPSMFLWLEFWFAVMIADFVLAALYLPEWDCRQDDSPIEQVGHDI